jgi:TRAP-type C4-dicarboxylate transport system permease small subunit
MMSRIKSVIDRIVDFTAGLLLATLVIIVLWQVLSRYLMKTPSPWTEELAGFLMIWLALSGAAAALRRKAHLGIDIVTSKTAGAKKMHLETVASIFSALFCFLVLFIGGSELVYKTMTTNQVSAVMGVKMGYVYLIVPISGAVMSFYCFEQMIESIDNHHQDHEVQNAV